ncbi:MAG: hypothetical protein ABI359_07080 [Ginsengibacter sp.]
MKRIFFLLICITVVSCNKNKPDSNSNVNGSIEYKINGTLFSFSNGLVKKVTGTPGAISTFYLIQGFQGNNSANIFIYTHSDTLKQQSYHLEYGSLPSFTQDSKVYTVLDTPDYFIDVLITSYKNGFVSGTFNGKVTHIISVNPSKVEDAAITDGKFNNLKVFYY